MTFDKPEHKKLCLEMINASQITGQALDIAYEFKQSVLKAAIIGDKKAEATNIKPA